MKPLASSRRPLFPRGPSLGLKMIVLGGVSLSLMFSEPTGPNMMRLRETLTWIIQPVLWVVSLPSHIAGGREYLKSRDSVIEENRQLREAEIQLRSDLSRLQALQVENLRIRELLSSSLKLEDRSLIAEVLSVAQDPYRHQIALNKGARDGLYRGQALVDSHGVLGQVVEVRNDSSIALLVTDPNHGIPVEINRTGLQTIALGRGDGQRLSLPYLPSNADVRAGDQLVSSPLGGRFPAGYPVGIVTDITRGDDPNFMEAVAQPAARINQGRQVLLVWSESFSVPTVIPPEAPPPDEVAAP